MSTVLPTDQDRPERIRVLHVDDDPDLLDLTATLLEDEDDRISVESATSASDALAVLASERFDCIVSDYDMPGQNGIEFLEAVRREHPDLPFVLFTGKGSEEVASDAISAGVSDYLQKGVGTEQYAVLANRVGNLVEKYRAERAQQRHRVLVEEATDVILVVGPDATISYATPSAESILGRTPRELVGTSGFAPIHPEDRDRVEAVFADLAADPGGRRSVEFRYERPDGSWIWAEARGRNLLGTDVVDGIVVYTRDITERKTHQQAIEGLHDTTRELLRAETPEEVGEITVEAVRDVLEMPANVVHLVDESDGGLAPVAWTDAGADLVGEIPTFHPGEGLAWEVFETGEPRVYDDVSTAPGRLNSDTEIRSEIILPLAEHGVLLIGSHEADAFDETDVSLARTLSAHATTVLHRIARETDLRETTERYRTLIDHFPAGGVFLYDEDLTCILAGGEGLSEAGLSVDDITGKRPRDRYPEAIAAELEAALRDAFEGESSVFEQTYRGRSYRIQTLPVGDVPVGYVMAVSQDITERTEREDALETLQERTQSLMHTTTRAETAQIAVDAAREVLGARLSGVHLRTNSRQTLEAVAFLDTVREELGEPPVYDRTAESDPASQFVWEAFESGDPVVVDDTRDCGRLAEATPARSGIVHPLGEYGVFIVSATEPDAFDATEKTLVEILATALTTALERVDRETRLREREQRVQTERDRLNALFEMVPDPITHVRFEHDEPIVIEVNESFAETFGVETDAAVGESVNDLVVPPDRRDAAEAIDERARETGGVSREVRRQTADGLGDFLFRSVPIDDSGETNEYYGIYVDISDQKATERRLERQNERLEEFASLVSHDLRNPLNVARGQLTLAERECDSESLTAVARAHERMDALIDDILTLAREGDHDADVEPVALGETAERCWQNVATGDATLVTDTDQTVRADPARLQRLLENLFGNAVEHGSTSPASQARQDAGGARSSEPSVADAPEDAVEHGGADVTVRIGELDGGFYVADDGPGIPDDQRERVFETGYSTSETGTGFGLAIVDEIVDAHGWRVRVTDGTDGGARLEFTGVSVVDT